MINGIVLDGGVNIEQAGIRNKPGISQAGNLNRIKRVRSSQVKAA